jgi:hypothetical protein
VRRSRRDIRLGRHLRVGQRYRRRSDDTVWRVVQVYRQDCRVWLEQEEAGRVFPTFAELRDGWVWIAPATRTAVTTLDRKAA